MLVRIVPGGAVDRVDIVSETPKGCEFAEKSVAALMQWKFAGAEPGTYKLKMTFQLN